MTGPPGTAAVKTITRIPQNPVFGDPERDPFFPVVFPEGTRPGIGVGGRRRFARSLVGRSYEVKGADSPACQCRSLASPFTKVGSSGVERSSASREALTEQTRSTR